MAADIPHLVKGIDLLQRGFASRYRAAVADKPSARMIRIGRLYLRGTNPAIDEALAASGFKAAWQSDLRRIFRKVDFIATPTMQSLPPKFPWFGSSVVFEWLVFDSQNTVGVNFAGNPAFAIPIRLPSNGKTSPVTSLQLVGPRLSEAELCNAGRLLASKP